MHEPIPRRVWLEVSSAALIENYNTIARTVAPCAVMPILKANAYGLGMLPIARILVEAGATCFGVAEPHEALQLLPLGKPVQILSTILPDEIPAMAAAGIILPLTDEATAALIAAQPVQPPVHIKIDTGMGRAGIHQSNAFDTITRIHSHHPNLRLEGLYTHFPQAYRNDPATHAQIAALRSLHFALHARGIHIPHIHCANSDAINNVPDAYAPPFNLVRTGLNLYGAFDQEGHRAIELKPVLQLKTRLAAVRDLPVGMTIGYGHTYKLTRPMRVGTISAGYADGLPLALSNRGQVDIRGTPCPILGRVSMDYTTISLENIPDAQPGDEVTCLGGTVSVEDWANLKNTHPYDIICSFGNRVERRYI